MLTVALAAGTAAAQSSKVGFVNPQRIVTESKIGKIAQEDLSRLSQEKDRRVRKAAEAVQKLQNELETGSYSASDLSSREKSLRVAIRDYEQLMENSALDLQGEERRLVKFVMGRADVILRRLAQQLGFTMILTNPEAIGYVADSMDITDHVIRELDAML